MCSCNCFFATLVQGGGQKVEDPRNNESTKLWYSSTSPAWAMIDVQPKDSNIKFVKLAATYVYCQRLPVKCIILCLFTGDHEIREGFKRKIVLLRPPLQEVMKEIHLHFNLFLGHFSKLLIGTKFLLNPSLTIFNNCPCCYILYIVLQPNRNYVWESFGQDFS